MKDFIKFLNENLLPKGNLEKYTLQELINLRKYILEIQQISSNELDEMKMIALYRDNYNFELPNEFQEQFKNAANESSCADIARKIYLNYISRIVYELTGGDCALSFISLHASINDLNPTSICLELEYKEKNHRMLIKKCLMPLPVIEVVVYNYSPTIKVFRNLEELKNYIQNQENYV